MYRATLLLLVVSAAAFAQYQRIAGQESPIHANLSQNGDHVMGFSHEKTTHHFVLTADGGLIEVRADNVKDAATLDQIRSHFQHIARMFAEGDFNAPMLVHGQNVPGTEAMSRMKSDLHWKLEDIPRGARIVITADNTEAADAVHEFLRFQISDHHTGDCTAVR
jgi:hypothetical protein